MNGKLKNLADKLGILTEYYDAGQNHKRYETSEDTVRFFAKQLGYKADTDADVEHSLVKFDNAMRCHFCLTPQYKGGSGVQTKPTKQKIVIIFQSGSHFQEGGFGK